MKALDEVKKKILGLLWDSEGPTSLKEVSEKIGLKIRSANMHLLALLKSGHVSKSKEGSYIITDSGREAIGFPKADQNLAKKILGKTSSEKAFHYYNAIDQPTGMSSNSLVDFCEKIKTLDTRPIDFHMARGDFQKWISSLGDLELAKRLALVREAGLKGQALKERLYKTVRSRCDELLKK